MIGNNRFVDVHTSTLYQPQTHAANFEAKTRKKEKEMKADININHP